MSLGERICLSLICHSPLLKEVGVISNLRQEPEAEAICWLPSHAWLVFLQRTTFPWNGAAHWGLGPHVVISNQDNPPQMCLQANLV